MEQKAFTLNFSIHLPPTTRHERITSSPSSMGPIVVLFMLRPQRSRIIGFSGRTKGEEEQRREMNVTARAGNISSDVIIMIRSVVPSASWAIEFLLKVETFTMPWMPEKAKKVFGEAQTSWKHIHSINFNVEASPALCWFCHHAAYPSTKSWKIIFAKKEKRAICFVCFWQQCCAHWRRSLSHQHPTSLYLLITVKLKRKLIVWLVWKSTLHR